MKTSSLRHNGEARAGSSTAGRERLRPALLDRLTDDAPDRCTESAGQFLLSERQYRESVLRDLRWLFNTSSLMLPFEGDERHAPASSVLNFGIQPLAGRRISEIQWHRLEHEIYQAIRTFEPRIIADSIEVRCMPGAESLAHHNLVALQIRGLLWSVPYPLEFLLRSEIDLESGRVDLQSEGL